MNRKCPICGGEFEVGLMARPIGILQWILLRWTKTTNNLGWSTNWNSVSLEIKTYKCKKCGYLESYAK